MFAYYWGTGFLRHFILHLSALHSIQVLNYMAVIKAIAPQNLPIWPKAHLTKQLVTSRNCPL